MSHLIAAAHHITNADLDAGLNQQRLTPCQYAYLLDAGD